MLRTGEELNEHAMRMITASWEIAFPARYFSADRCYIVVMTKSYVTGAGAEELKRIDAELPVAKARLDRALLGFGMETPKFLEADTAYGKLLRRRNEITGDSGKPWNA
jgi:hypothetical protein